MGLADALSMVYNTEYKLAVSRERKLRFYTEYTDYKITDEHRSYGVRDAISCLELYKDIMIRNIASAQFYQTRIGRVDCTTKIKEHNQSAYKWCPYGNE